MKRLNVNLEDGLHAQLKVKSFEQGETVAAPITRLVETWLNAKTSTVRSGTTPAVMPSMLRSIYKKDSTR